MEYGMKPNSMGNLETSVILSVLQKGGTIQKCNSLIELVKRKETTDEISKVIKLAASDDSPLWNSYLVSDFAKAALDVLGIRKYDGNREEINNLISVKLCFN